MQPDEVLLACEENIRQRELIPAGKKILVAFSGGGDSTALLDCLIRLQKKWAWQVCVAHFHHGLRDESDQEAKDAELRIRERYGSIPFFYARLPVAELSAQKSISFEMAGREARYQALSHLSLEHNCDVIAMGHQLDDQTETMLWRFLKGTGPEGLSGIRWSRPLGDKRVVRPLLSIPKKALEQYCQSRGLAYFEDASNLDVSIPRNRLRQRLIPHLKKEYNPNVETALWQLSQIMQDEQAWLRQLSKDMLGKLSSKDSSGNILISLPNFLEQPVALQRLFIIEVWFELGNGSPMPWRMVEKIRTLAQRGKVGHAFDLPRGWRAVVRGNQLVFKWQKSRKEFTKPYEYRLKIPGKVEVPESGHEFFAYFVEDTKFDASSLYQSGDGNTVWVDESNLQSNFLTVRNRRPGDRFWPLGMPSEMKLKDFLIKSKVPVEERGLLPLLFDGDQLIWVVGIRLSEVLRMGETLKGRLLKIGFDRL